MEKLYIIGGQSTALEIRDTVKTYYKDAYVVYNIVPDSEDKLIEFYINDTAFYKNIKEVKSESCFIVGLTDPIMKQKIREKCLPYLAEVNIIHPNSIVWDNVKLGKGNYIAANTVLSTNAIIGDCNIINYNVTIGHDVVIGDFNTFNPGVRISGRVVVGNSSLFGANSFVYQGLNISNSVLIDALTYVDRDVEEEVMCTSLRGTIKKVKRRNIR